MSSVGWLNFGIKSASEVTRDGVVGILTQGYASLYNVTDQDGEHQEPGAFADIVDTWGRQERPPVDFEHGRDPILRTAPIGWGTKYELDDQGLYCECFLPRDPVPPFQENAEQKTARWRQVYRDILRGKIRGYSVQGVYERAGKALRRWSMNLLTITNRPCLPQATFTLGAKALDAAYEQALGERRWALGGPADGTPTADAASLTPNASPLAPTGEEGGAVKGLQTQSGADVTMAPLCVPAGHVTVSAPLLSAAGTQQWTLSYGSGANASAVLEAGAKAVTKAEPDGDHPSSHYLSVGDPAKPSTWKLRVRDAQGDLDPRLLGACHAALTVGYRGQKVDLPDEEKQRCLRRLKALYKQAGLDRPEDEQRTSGKKAEQEVLADALGVLQQFEAGRKAGRTHSAATLHKVQQVISLLEEHFGLGDDDSDEDAAENEDDDSEAPLS